MLGFVLVPLAIGAGLAVALPQRWAAAVAVTAIAAAGVPATLGVRRLLVGEAATGWGGMLRLDAAGALVLLLVLGLLPLASLVASQTEQWARRFHALLLAFTGTMALAAMADNLGLLWASVEATTLSSALLVGHRRTRQATEAAWKYLILSSTGILFAFVATLLVVLAGRGVGATTLSWAGLLASADGMDPGLVRLALALATVGYGTKAGLVPYHFWLPDAHSEAPSPVSALLSGVLLSCALLALDRFTRIGRAAGVHMTSLPLILGVVSVVVGGALVLAARSHKRMLAYSSIENMGLVAVGIALGTPLALAGAYLHILAHGVSKALAFFAAGRVHHHLGTTAFTDTSDLLRRTPAAGRAMLIGFLALAGAQLLGPFTSKLLLLGALFQDAPAVAVVGVLAGMLLAFMGFLRHAATMMPAPARPAAAPAADAMPAPLAIAREPRTVVIAFAVLVIASLAIGLLGPALLEPLLGQLGAGATAAGVAP